MVNLRHSFSDSIEISFDSAEGNVEMSNTIHRVRSAKQCSFVDAVLECMAITIRLDVIRVFGSAPLQGAVPGGIPGIETPG
jgi:hypothetical protein